MLLGKAGRVVPATGRRRTARGRLGVTDGNDLNEFNLPETYGLPSEKGTGSLE
jgi:hypothetical protein